MLEKYIAALLVPYLSKYVENINEDQLKINIWSGKAALNDLVLRPEALDALLSAAGDEEGEADRVAAGASPVSGLSKKKKPPIPVKAHRGICKNVSLTIPIKHLRSEPVVVEVGELLLTLKGVSDLPSTSGAAATAEDATLTSSDGLHNVKAERWTAIAEAKARELLAFEAERKRLREQKEQTDQQTTAAAASLKDADSAKKSGGGFFSRLGEVVINNVIVKVQTVHIRYEDEATETVMGAVLGGVQLLTMNEATGQPMFTDPSGLQRMWKRLVFNDLQVYCDDPSHVRANAPLGRTWCSKMDDWRQWYHRMRQRARDGSIAMSTILGPVSGCLDAKVVFKMFVRDLLTMPYADVSVKLQHVMASLTRGQYSKILQTLMLFSNQAEVSELQRMRPRVPVKGNARQWWRYAIRAVRSVLEEPRRAALLSRVSAVCKLDYQVLYRDVVRQHEMTPEKKRTYRFVTRFMSVEDMKAGRRYVYGQIANEIQLKRKDNEIRKAEEMAKQHQASMLQQKQAQEQKAQQGQAKRGWMAWLIGTNEPTNPADAISNTATAKEIEEDERFFKGLESDYGISSTDSEAYQSAVVAFSPEEESGLPPSYCWLRATFDLPFMSYRIDTEQGDSVTLKIFHLRGGVTTFNKPNSMLFYFRMQNITLANPAAAAAGDGGARRSVAGSSAAAQGCEALVPYLIEGVQVNRRPSKSSPTGERVTVRSLTSLDWGKQPPPSLEMPRIEDVVEVEGSAPPSPLMPVQATGRQVSATAELPRSHSSTSGEDDRMPPQELLAASDYPTPLFSITGFLNPVEQPLADTTVDVAVKVQLLPLRIVADPSTIEHLISFFTLPAGVDVSGFAESTKHAATAVGSAASQELRASMAKAKGLYITVDASAPVLILPKSLSASAEETALSVSLGRVRFHARPLSGTEKQRRLTAAAAITDKPPLQTPSRPSLADTGSSPSSPTATAATEEALFYYPHKASFSKFYLELTTVEKAMRRPQRGFLLVPEVSIAADVLQRIDDRNTSREAFVFRLKVPQLRVACSLHQVYLLTSLADAWTAHLRTKAAGGATAGMASGGVGAELLHEQNRSSPASESMEMHGDAAGVVRGRGGESGVASPSPAAAASSPTTSAPARANAGGDPPVMRLELLVQRLGLDLHDDDAQTLAVSPLPAYKIECASAEVIFAVRTRHKKMVLWLQAPHIVAAKDAQRPVLSCGGIRADVLMLEGETPTGVAVSLDGELAMAVGTACVEMLETTMDVVNLILSALNNSSGNSDDGANPGAMASSNNRSFLTVAGGKVDLLGNESGKDVPAGLARVDANMGGASNRLSDLAYQMNMVRQQCAMPNRHVADVFVRVQGPATLTLLNRAPGATEDTPFATAAISDVEIQLSKFAVTMDLSGRVGEVSADVLDASGLVPENRALLAYTPCSAHPRAAAASAVGEDAGGEATSPPGDAGMSSFSSSSDVDDRGADGTGAEAAEASSSSGTGEPNTSAHISFSFRKSRPVMPLFKDVDGKRVLANAQELRYSSALELLIGSSTITLDLNTVMVLKTYFISGLFSRLSKLSDRPLYNGLTLPPAREGPRLLMSFRVVVRDTAVVLPVDPRRSGSHRFCASLGSMVLENSLHAAQCKETMNITFGEVGLWREGPPAAASASAGAGGSGRRRPRRTAAHSALLPRRTFFEMAVRTPLDLLSDDAPHIDVRSEDVSLELRETDFVQLVTLLRQNLMRTDAADIAAYSVAETKPVRQVVVGKDGRARLLMHPRPGDSASAMDGASAATAAAATDDNFSSSFAVSVVARATQRRSEEMFFSMRLGRISMLLTDEATEPTSNPISASASRFQLQSTGLAMTVALPSNHVGMRWKSLQLDDARDNTSSALLVCEEGTVHLADSLTTQSILMCDFGVRRNALRSVDPNEWQMGSLTSSSGATGGTAPQSHGNSKEDGEGGVDPTSFSLADVGAAMAPRSRSGTASELLTISVLSADFTLRRLAVSDQWLALYDVTCNEAVASAWTAPQTGMKSATAAGAGDTGKAEEVAAAAAASSAAAASNRGMRIFVTTPSVVIPFMNSRRETLIEANIAALLVDVARLPNASTKVAVKVRELTVRDAVSGEKIVYRKTSSASGGGASTMTTTTTATNTRTANHRSASSPALSPAPAGAAAAAATFNGGSAGASRTATPAVAPATQDDWEDGWEDVDAPFSPLVGKVAQDAAGEGYGTAGAAAAAAGPAEEPEVLQFTFKSDPETNTNKIQLGIGALHTLLSMPLINGLTDYFTSPFEPVAKIASLGVMREQRARMAAAAQQMANSSHLVLHVLWRQPRIILAGDGMQLKRRSSNLEMRLGVMRTAVHMKSSAGTISVVVKVQEYSIPSLLKRSALRFAYESVRGAEKIELNMDRTTAQFYPTEVERFVLLGQRNLLLPRDSNYYGRYEKAASPAVSPSMPNGEPGGGDATTTDAASPSASPAGSGGGEMGGVPPLPVRTVQVHIDGLMVAVHDAVGLNTHTISLSALDTFVAADGRVDLVVPTFYMLDQSTNRYLMQSNTKTPSPHASPNASLAAPVASVTQNNADNATAGEAGLDGTTARGSSSASHAVRLSFDPAERSATVRVGAVLFTVIPRSIGALANTILSVTIPAPPASATAATATAVVAPLPVTTDARSVSGGSEGRVMAVQPAPATVPAAGSRAAAADGGAAASSKPFTLRTTLAECKVRFCQGEREVAMLRLSRIACNSVSHPDGANELAVSLGNLFMVDSLSVNTNYRTFVYPYKDAEGEQAELEASTTGGGQGTAGGAGGGGDSTADSSPTMGSREETAFLSSSTARAPLVHDEGLVTYELKTILASKPKNAPSIISGTATPAATAAIAAVPTYSKRMRCRVRSLSFVFVPDVVRAVMDVVREVQTHVSEGNRTKVQHYVSDRAAKSVKRTDAADELTEVDVIVSRPQLLLVDKPTATTGVQLSPGSLVVKSRLVVPGSPELATLATAGPAASGAAASSPLLKDNAAATAEGTMHERAEGTLALQAHEVFTVQVRRLGMLLQETSCFQQDCNISIEYQRSLATAGRDAAQHQGPDSRSSSVQSAPSAVPVPPGPGSAAAPAGTQTPPIATAAGGGPAAKDATMQNALLKIDVPVLSMMFTQQQTDFAMDVLGAVMNGTVVERVVATTSAPPAAGDEGGRAAASPLGEGGSSASGRHEPASPGVSPLPPPSTTATAGAGNARRSGGAVSPVAPANASAAAAPSSPSPPRAVEEHLYDPNAVVPLTAFSLDARVGMLQADLADLFRLRIEDVLVQSTTMSTTGKTMDVRVGSLLVQHVGAEVDAETSASISGAGVSPGPASSPTRSGAPSPPRKTARVQDLVDLLIMTKLRVRQVQPQPSIDVATASSMVESTMSISAAVLNVAVSPTILFDTRELLYLPFCYKVLRIPIDPVPVLNLMDETTTLQDDLILDDKHVLLTASRTRCCYVLDLNKHRLVLSGAPSGQIVLSEGCELTIMNGTICIPGMYTIGSYVSFAPCTALFTTDTCVFEKEYLNVGNAAFFESIMGRPAMAAPSPPASTRSSQFSVPSPSSSVDAFSATAAPRGEGRVPPTAPDSVIDLRDRTVRVMADFYCDEMQLRMLSEEVVDLSVSLLMQAHVKFVQDWENEQPVRRTISLQTTNVHSPEDEEHLLLPTDMVLNISGVDNVSVSLVLDSMEFCTRTTLLRSLVELGKDFGAAFIEETTVSRVKPRIEYETQSLDALYPVLQAGECQHCGRDGAYLALAQDKPGILCYKCCTGYDSLPAIDFRVEIPLVDGVLFGSSGDMAHVYVRNVLLSVDPSMELQLTARMSLFGFSNAAAVWEPIVEQFDATITGSVSSHDYRMRMDRLDYVVSPQNIRLLSGMAADYGDATALQKQLRKRFRRQKQQRTQQIAPNQGVPMYVNAGILEEVARVEMQEEELTLLPGGNDDADATVNLFHPIGTNSAAYPPLNDVSVAAMANMSIFDVLNSTNRRLLAGLMAQGGEAAGDTHGGAEPPKRGYAHVHVTNHCNAPLLVEGRRVTPRGGKLRFVAKGTTVRLKRELTAEDAGQDEHVEDYATSISNPPLYMQARDMVFETKVVLSQEDSSRYLRRTITMAIYPLHSSNTIICFENRLQCPLASTGNYPPIKPGERFYLAPKTDLNTPIQIQPVRTADRVEYEVGKAVGDALDGRAAGPQKLLSIHDVLCGVPMVLMCKAKGTDAKSMTVKVYVRQEEMRGGLPVFVIAVEPRFRLRNKLPYRLIVNVLPDPNGDLAKGRTPTRPVQPLVSTVLDVRQGADLPLHTYRVDQVAFMLEVRQRRPPQSSSGGAGAASASKALSTHAGRGSEEEEVFSTLVPTAVLEDKPYISLRSQFRRELRIHAFFVPNKGSLVFSTPYVLLNHSPIPLTLRECTRDGTNKLYDAEPNYTVLHAGMNASVAAAPQDIKKSEDFFVNIYYEQYRGTCVPLHAQQRGVVILQDCTKPAPKPKVSSTSCGSSSGSRKKGAGGAASATTVGPTVVHLAYSAQVDPSGSLLVTFTPRWVVVNRSHLPLYVAPSTYNGITAKEAAATATAAMVASQQAQGERAVGAKSGAAEGEAAAPSSPTQQQQQKVDEMKSALQELGAENSVVFLSDAPTQVVALPPYSATPLYETPLCPPEVGYNLHILQSPLAPLYGTPVGIENIHSELIVAYKPPSDTRGAERGGGGRTGTTAASPSGLAERDRFLEVSLVVRDSYTYVVLEPPERVPYLLLNRTSYPLEVRDTAAKSKGRLMAQVSAGCGTELVLDTTVTTLMQVRLFTPDKSQVVYEVVVDVGRPMTRREMSAAVAAPFGVTYSFSYGGFGQQIFEICPAKAALQPAYTSVAAPPIPINVLTNLAVATLSVVMPNRDILFCAVTDIRFSWDRQKDREIMMFSIENFQVDNQTEVSPRYDSCVLSLRTSSSFAAASGYVERILVPAKGLICLEEVRLDLVPLALRVSDTLLVACAGFVQAVRSGEIDAETNVSGQSMLGGSTSTIEMQEAAAAPHERCPTPTKLYAHAPVQIDAWASKLTLERFIINPIVVRVWLTRDTEGHDFFRENINSKDAALLSMLVSSCEDVSVAVPGIVTAKQASRLGVFVEWVGKTYADGLLSQLKGLLLQYASSLPMIGAPLKLASGFGNGAVRLFREPIDGLSTSATAFAQGLASGGAGFAQEFAGGGLGAFSNFTDSWSRVLSMGGGVSEQERRKQNTLTGFANGFMGIIQRPMEGAAESGATGFLKGTAHGLVGVVANPVSGLLSDVSRATGTLGKLVTDTYIPKTHRLRPIRDFHANGGVAPWRSLVSVYQYQRIKMSTRTFSGDQLMSSVDGPEWYPSQREGATYGKNRTPIPAERWTLDRYHTNFEGWTYSTRYYGLYSERLTAEVRVRRMRWTALVRPLPYSRIAFYLRVAPGMETQRRRTASIFSTPSMSPQETTVEFTTPGQVQAITVEQVTARRKRFFGIGGIHRSRSGGGSSGGGSGGGGADSRSGSRSPRSKSKATSEYFAEEEYANQRKSLHQRMRQLTATGRSVGVKTDVLRGPSGLLGDEDPNSGSQGGAASMYASTDAGSPGTGSPASPGIRVTRGTAELQAPDAPRSRQTEKKPRYSRSASELDATSGASTPPPDRQGSSDADKAKRREEEVSRKDKTRAEAMAAAAAATQRSGAQAAGSTVPQPGSTRFVRSNSGKVDSTVASGATLAAVPGASPTFVSRTSSTAMGPLPTTIVEVYEYEKKVALLGWGKRYLPSECPGWQDAHGNEVPCRQDIRAPAGWSWTTDWTVVGGDSTGWTMMNAQKNLRRRMWQRRLVQQPAGQGQPK